MRRFRLAACKACVKARVRPASLRSLRVGLEAGGELLLVGLLLARPGARGVGERLTRLVVDDRARALEDGALERRRGHDLAEAGLAMRRLRRLLVVDQAPCLLEQLLADEPGEQAARHAEGNEEKLHERGNVYPVKRSGIPAPP